MIKYGQYIKKSNSIQSFIKDCKLNNQSHAYLVMAEDYPTLKDGLYFMCQTLLCKNEACGICKICTRIEDKNHANVFLLDGEKESIKVDAVNELINGSIITPLEQGYKVFLILSGEKMTEQAQNKLLKTLEEPPKDVIIIIGVLNENLILPTIKSRCKKLYLNIWTEELIKTELTQLGVTGDTLKLAVNFAGGSIAKAKEIVEDKDFINRYDKINNMLLTLQSSPQIAEYCGVFGTDKFEFQKSMTTLEGIIGMLIREHVSLISSPLTKKFAQRTLVNIYDLILNTNKKLSSNCPIPSLETSILMGILETRYKFQ